MIRATALLVFLSLFSPCLPHQQSPERLPIVVLKGGTRIDVHSGRQINNSVIVLEGGRIKQVGTENETIDIVILNSNPLIDIRNTANVDSVVVSGRFMDRKALDEMLARAEAAAKKK